ncbi:DUF4232 domain-containing protein [Streptomyces tanashiensis]|uniref:DUF4232 domain-containing protein n=1 Tax=Streptomyces tanashiensis TaxID=67367 RepID=A0ABY6RAS5_9ACTN|nr:DUF4232 domain-containing protein [Streptomyces tanashiensis]UZX26379.1 DUF4232 domain-containing protein [Streptomyces tanashiensis]
MKASLGPDRPGASQSNVALVLINASRRPCTIHGFPGVAFVKGEGEAVTPDPERGAGEEPQTVTLAPGASAWSALTYANVSNTGKASVPRLSPFRAGDGACRSAVDVGEAGRGTTGARDPLGPGGGLSGAGRDGCAEPCARCRVSG